MTLVNDAAAVAATLEQEGRQAEAQAIWRLVLSAEPWQADALHALGRIALGEGWREEAPERLHQTQAADAARSGPNADRAQALAETCRRIKTLYQDGRTDEARRLYACLLDVDPAGLHLRYLLDEQHDGLPEFLMGLDLLEQAVKAAPDSALFRQTVAKLIEVSLLPAMSASFLPQSRAIVRRLCQTILRHQPDHGFVLHLLGVALRQDDECGTAAQAIRQALVVEPTIHGAHYNLARCLTQGDGVTRARREEAVRLLSRALILSSGEAPVRLHLIWHLLSLGRYAEAWVQYQNYCGMPLNAAELVHTKALIEPQFLHWSAAEKAVRRSLADNPGRMGALEVLGMCLLEQDCLNEAVAVLRRAALFNDTPDGVGLRLTEAYHRLGQRENALRATWMTCQRRFDGTYDALWSKDPINQVLDSIDAAIPREVDRDGALVYLMHGIASIGHLVTELATLTTLYGPRYRRIIFLTRDPALVKGINPEVFRIATQHVTVVPIRDNKLLELSYAEIGLFERGGVAYLLHSWKHIYHRLFHLTRTGVKRTWHGLLPDQMERGRALQRKLGIPEDARIVVMHLRQAPTDAVNRNVSPDKYHAAIRHLVREGYFVIRIGDPKMTPLPDLGGGVNSQILDAPFSPHYEPLIDPYFIHQSDFMLSSQSGPAEMARIFHKPTITPNVPLVELYTAETIDYFGFRRYIDHSSGRPRLLGFSEIMRLHHDLHYVLRLAIAGIEVVEQTSEEILDVVKEGMQPGRLDEKTPMSAPQQAFRQLAEQDNLRRSTDRRLQMRYLDWSSYATDYVRVADCCLAGYPELLT